MIFQKSITTGDEEGSREFEEINWFFDQLSISILRFVWMFHFTLFTL